MTDQRLTQAWKERNKLYAEGGKLWAEGYRLRFEGEKLWAEARKLWAEGDRLFREAVIAVHGRDVKITWTDDGCELSTGEVFGDD